MCVYVYVCVYMYTYRHMCRLFLAMKSALKLGAQNLNINGSLSVTTEELKLQTNQSLKKDNIIQNIFSQQKCFLFMEKFLIHFLYFLLKDKSVDPLFWFRSNFI